MRILDRAENIGKNRNAHGTNTFSSNNNIFNLRNGNGFSVKEVIDTCEKSLNVN